MTRSKMNREYTKTQRNPREKKKYENFRVLSSLVTVQQDRRIHRRENSRVSSRENQEDILSLRPLPYLCGFLLPGSDEPGADRCRHP